MSSEKRDASPEASPLKGPAPKAVPEDTSDVAFEDGVPLNPMAGDQSVQFISGTPANGDAKVEIGDSGATAPTFVGLGKEELMKYANDPFWVRLRWFLFILFWILWIAMLVGAIVIIVLAPRCAEKKTVAETYYQIKASELTKDSKIDENTSELMKIGAQNIIITEALQHQPGEPEAVTDFEKFHDDQTQGLLVKAIQELQSHGIKVLLQIVPNHSGTDHSWFNESSSPDKYVRMPYDDVKNSIWVTQGSGTKHTAWTKDERAGFENTAYLQQFTGNVADLNFKNSDIISAFKQILRQWREKSFDGFLIGKASYLIEDLDNLATQNATINQAENVKVVSSIAGVSQSITLVELVDASEETVQQYINKNMIPLLKSSNYSSPEKVQQLLETLNRNPKAVMNLPSQSSGREKARLVSMLASAGGSHSLLSHDSSDNDGSQFLQNLIEFQKNNPKGKSSNVTFVTNGDIVSALRIDENDHLILANMGSSSSTFSPSALNIDENVKGKVVLATSNSEQKIGDTTNGNISLNPLSGLVIKLEKKES